MAPTLPQSTARMGYRSTSGRVSEIKSDHRLPRTSKNILREKAKMSERMFALTADVAEAHRQVPIDPVDCHYLRAQIRPGDVVYVNTVGTFGISSASYCWSRVGSSLGRLSQYLSAHTAHTWHLLVADDFHLEAGGAGYREALMIFLFCVIRRVYRYRGRRPQAVTLSYGSVSKYSIAHSVSAYRKGGQNGL